MATTPYEILQFIGRGVSLRDYERLKAALDPDNLLNPGKVLPDVN